MAGYSTRTLAQKLGLKEGKSSTIINPPYPLEKLFATPLTKLEISNGLDGKFSFIQFFTKSKNELSQKFPQLKTSLELDGFLWVSWPKRSSKIPTDLNETIVREIGLREGLVDVKVAAIDETWSGIKFVYRLKDRT